MNLARTLHRCLEIPGHLRVFGPDTRLLRATLGEWLDQQSRTTGVVSVTIYLHGAPAEWDLADWPVDDLFRRLEEAGAKVEVVLESRALTDKGLTIAQKLDLHRLSANASLGLAEELPFVKDEPVIAAIENTQGPTVVATSAENEAIPGPHWGLGEEAPLVRGCADKLPETSEFSGEQLVRLSSGNARLILVGAQLDGQVANFGRRFWALLEVADPIIMASIRTHGVRKAVYSDRYLLTPLNLRLFLEVFRLVPGGKPKKI